MKAAPIAAERLKSFVERVEKLLEERHAIQGDIRDVFSEAKGIGYDVRTMRSLIKLRAMDAADRDEQEALLDTYALALGMVIGGNPISVRTSEEELEERAARIFNEVDRCMALVGADDAPPKIEAIRALIGCSAGKAHKLRGFVARRIADGFSRSIASDRENENEIAPPVEMGAEAKPEHANNDSTPVTAHEGEEARQGGAASALSNTAARGLEPQTHPIPRDRSRLATLTPPQPDSCSTEPAPMKCEDDLAIPAFLGRVTA